jgi:hypothetical protein
VFYRLFKGRGDIKAHFLLYKKNQIVIRVSSNQTSLPRTMNCLLELNNSKVLLEVDKKSSIAII